MKLSAPWVAGGMGEVYGARDSVLKREVAISLAAAGARESTSGSTPFRRDPGNLSRREACLVTSLTSTSAPKHILFVEPSDIGAGQTAFPGRFDSPETYCWHFDARAVRPMRASGFSEACHTGTRCQPQALAQ